ncbi:thymidine phosphorylase [Nocardia sp. NPDC056064]|uniref:thymidine phosphorylase n=1 Tax=Nocardia sp. NPDC056064 TaxID=3345701 RepID=UPI0035D6DE13
MKDRIVVTAIEKMFDQRRLSDDDVRGSVAGFIDGTVSDLTIATWLGAFAARDVDFDEVKSLTDAYIASGRQMESGPRSGPVPVDKHSSGGVGDKVSLTALPVISAMGIPVLKLSGGALGLAGGTADKLASIPGFRVQLGHSELESILARSNLVIGSQTADLCPGDSATYRVRDLCGAVKSAALIAASIVSKKVAAGSTRVVYHIKWGEAGLVSDEASARGLGELIDALSRAYGIKSKIVYSAIYSPAGYCVGNLLEVIEARRFLGGHSAHPTLREEVYAVCRALLEVASFDPADADRKITTAIENGDAVATFDRWLVAQGADKEFVDDPELYFSSLEPERRPVHAKRSGIVARIDPLGIAEIAATLGSAKEAIDDCIDPVAGIELKVEVGTEVSAGDVIATLWSGQPISEHLELLSYNSIVFAAD